MPELKDKITPLRTLIVDDDALVRSYLCSTLRQLGCQDIAEARNDTDALGACTLQRPDIIFLDIELAGSSGLDLIAQLLQERPEQSIVMLSGNGTLDNVRAAIANGASGFIVKPFTPAKIAQALHNAYERKHSRPPAPERVTPPSTPE